MSHNLNPMSFEFCGGDIFDAQCSATSNSTLTNMNRSLVDAGISAQVNSIKIKMLIYCPAKVVSSFLLCFHFAGYLELQKDRMFFGRMGYILKWGICAKQVHNFRLRVKPIRLGDIKTSVKLELLDVDPFEGLCRGSMQQPKSVNNCINIVSGDGLCPANLPRKKALRCQAMHTVRNAYYTTILLYNFHVSNYT